MTHTSRRPPAGSMVQAASLSQVVRGQTTTLTDEDVARFRAGGYWQQRTLRSVLSDVSRDHPARTALVGYRKEAEHPVRMSYAEFDASAHHAAVALSALGVGDGDAVALMLPNWVEYASLMFGIFELGGIYTGIPVSYGENQAKAILRRSKAKVLVVAAQWRGADLLGLARRLRDDLPTLEHILVLGPNDSSLGANETHWSSLADLPDKRFTPPDPGQLCYLGFTSGTTGEPKGAMHNHETLLYDAEAMGVHALSSTFGDPMVQLVASPIGHHTGFVWGVLFTLNEAGTGVFVDQWNPQWGAEVIRSENVTTLFGAPTFLQDLMRTDLAGDPDCTLRCVVMAGSSVPRNLPAQAGEAFGAYIAPAWGMTECGILSCATPREPDDVLQTDGSVFQGSQLRVVDTAGDPLPAGEVGMLQMRGPAVTLGYYDRPDATAEHVHSGRWFDTGDTALLDDNGYLVLQGRTKDVIIRGGENIPATDVETLLFDHPDVLNAAIVGYPDERLGERACAMLVLREGATLRLDELCDYLLRAGLSKHYLPERLELLPELPMTMSGKIQKFKLRERLAKESS